MNAAEAFCETSEKEMALVSKSRKPMTAFATSPDPCVEARGFAHHWLDISQSKPGDAYAEGRCLYCDKKRLFKTAWPHKLDWQAIKKERQDEERRRFKTRKVINA